MCNQDSRRLIHIQQSTLGRWENQLKERKEEISCNRLKMKWHLCFRKERTHRDCMHVVDFLCILEGRYTELNGDGFHTGHWLRTWSLNRHRDKCLGDRPHCRHSRCLNSIPIWHPLKHAKVGFTHMLMPKKLLWSQKGTLEGLWFHTSVSLKGIPALQSPLGPATNLSGHAQATERLGRESVTTHVWLEEQGFPMVQGFWHDCLMQASFEGQSASILHSGSGSGS